jgi:uncharacterized repeat protein (TIGR03803 family)
MNVVYRAIIMALAPLILAAWTLPAPVETVLYRFQAGSDGEYPLGGLIADKKGTLYGKTSRGGLRGVTSCDGGCGVVFKLTPPLKGQTAWRETVLYRFCSLPNCSDGILPQAGLIVDEEGALYGTTAGGTVFKLTPAVNGQTAWTETTLYTFQGGGDGTTPVAGLIADRKGSLYGTTSTGGGGNCGVGCGTVFKLTPPRLGQTAWTETVIYRFCARSNCSDGFGPVGGLIADEEGALYGTNGGGGTGNWPNGYGTIFKLTPPRTGQTAWTETTLYTFQGGGDGAAPVGLLFKKEGALYGTTSEGGGGNACPQVYQAVGCGTVFKLTPPGLGQTAWSETVLHRFSGGSDGAVPFAGLIADREGALYGTTYLRGSGADPGNGTVFKLTPPRVGQTAWTEAVLHRFSGGSDGANPVYAGLIADKEGALYGTTQGGNGYYSTTSFGTVFKLTLCPEPKEEDWRKRGEDHDRDHRKCPAFLSME